jgi:hypothetical protein
VIDSDDDSDSDDDFDCVHRASRSRSTKVVSRIYTVYDITTSYALV